MSESSMNLLTSPIVPSPRLNVSPSQAGRANETYQKPRIKTGLNLATVYTVSRQATGAVEQWYLLVLIDFTYVRAVETRRIQTRQDTNCISNFFTYVCRMDKPRINFVQL